MITTVFDLNKMRKRSYAFTTHIDSKGRLFIRTSEIEIAEKQQVSETYILSPDDITPTIDYLKTQLHNFKLN